MVRDQTCRQAIYEESGYKLLSDQWLPDHHISSRTPRVRIKWRLTAVNVHALAGFGVRAPEDEDEANLRQLRTPVVTVRRVALIANMLPLKSGCEVLQCSQQYGRPLT